MNKKYVVDVLLSNGIDANYLEEMGDEVETGCTEWMDVVSEITGKNAYDTSTITDDDYAKVKQFMSIMKNELGIGFF